LGSRKPRSIDTDSFTHAAVLIPIFQHNGDYRLLFIKRSHRVKKHKGQISFPGGVVDETDPSFEHTALREAREEIGLAEEDVEVLGSIDDVKTLSSNYIVHPFVGFMPYPYPFKLSKREVSRILEIPFSHFLDEEKGDRNGAVMFRGVNYKTPMWEYEEDVIWGATARIMVNFLDILGKDFRLA
jgi:8-oxo-dGTP pyrophosphatase MutT (NUDIX family)